MDRSKFRWSPYWKSPKNITIHVLSILIPLFLYDVTIMLGMVMNGGDKKVRLLMGKWVKNLMEMFSFNHDIVLRYQCFILVLYVVWDISPSNLRIKKRNEETKNKFDVMIMRIFLWR